MHSKHNLDFPRSKPTAWVICCPRYIEKFGNVTTHIADLSTLDGRVLVSNPIRRQTQDVDIGASAKLDVVCGWWHVSN